MAQHTSRSTTRPGLEYNQARQSSRGEGVLTHRLGIYLIQEAFSAAFGGLLIGRFDILLDLYTKKNYTQVASNSVL